METSSAANPPHLIDSDKKIVILPELVGNSRVISLDLNQEVIIGCVGPSNSIRVTGNQLANAVCLSNSNLLVDGSAEYTFGQLGCLTQNKEILVENGTCGDNLYGTTIKIGWQAGPDFIPLYDTCHDQTAELNYSSINYIYGSSAAAADKSNIR